MVELKGTEKQVKWAKDIRKEVLKGLYILKEMREVEHKARNKKRTLAQLEEINSLINKAENETSAKWYIDNFSYLLRMDFNKLTLYEEVSEITSDEKLAFEVYNAFKKMMEFYPKI